MSIPRSKQRLLITQFLISMSISCELSKFSTSYTSDSYINAPSTFSSFETPKKTSKEPISYSSSRSNVIPSALTTSSQTYLSTPQPPLTSAPIIIIPLKSLPTLLLLPEPTSPPTSNSTTSPSPLQTIHQYHGLPNHYCL